MAKGTEWSKSCKMSVSWIFVSGKGVPRGVPRVFQGCFHGVSRVFQGCFVGVSRVFQGIIEVVLRVFQGCLRIFQGYLKG